MATSILKDGLTNKQRILRMVERWDENIAFEQALYHLQAMKEVMEAIKEAEADNWQGVDHDELFDQLERLCDEEESATSMDAKSAKKSKGTPSADRGSGHAKNGQGVRKTPKKIRRSAS